MKYLLIDENNDKCYVSFSLEGVIDTYEEESGESFKNEQGHGVYILENPAPIEVEFKIVKKTVVKIVNGPKEK